MLPQIDLAALKPTPRLDRKVLSDSDLASWQQSLPFAWIQAFIEELMQSTEGLNVQCGDTSLPIDQLCAFLDEVTVLTQDAPTFEPAGQKVAFKEFRAKLAALATSLHVNLLPSLLRADVLLPELEFHLLRSFGSISRLDYGTGHELSFLFYLLILRLTSILQPHDVRAIIEKVLPHYWKTSSQVRTKFGLVVAGKRGVWKKDQETGKVWFDSGASQARVHPTRSTSSLHTASSLHLNTSSTPLHLLRSLLAPQSTSTSSQIHPSSSPSPSTRVENDSPSSSSLDPRSLSSSSSPRTPSPPSRSSAPSPLAVDSRTGLYQLYLHTTLVSLPCLLHLRFGSVLPFVSSSSSFSPDHPILLLPSSADSLSTIPRDLDNDDDDDKGNEKENEDEEDETLERLQNEREGFESTVAPWNLPTLSGQEGSPRRRTSPGGGGGGAIVVEKKLQGLDLGETVAVAEGGQEGGGGKNATSPGPPPPPPALKRGKSRLSISELA